LSNVHPNIYKQVVIPQPEDRKIYLKDILEKDVDEKYLANLSDRYPKKNINKGIAYNPYSDTFLMEKARALNTGCGSVTTKNATAIIVKGNDKHQIRRLTPIECERLQSIPDRYTEIGINEGKEKIISDTQRYKALGNGFNCAVIKHIIKSIL
jgi:site-specific DNA-cytosine methylase